MFGARQDPEMRNSCCKQTNLCCCTLNYDSEKIGLRRILLCGVLWNETNILFPASKIGRKATAIKSRGAAFDANSPRTFRIVVCFCELLGLLYDVTIKSFVGQAKNTFRSKKSSPGLNRTEQDKNEQGRTGVKRTKNTFLFIHFLKLNLSRPEIHVETGAKDQTGSKFGHYW